MVDITDHELTRRNLWIHAATRCNSFCRYGLPNRGAELADLLLAEYDKRFKEPLPEPKPKPKRKVAKETPIKAGSLGGSPSTVF